MSNQLVFLFSPSSEDCIDTWKILKEQNILNTLIKINVDDPQNKVPVSINILPTLLIRGEKMLKGKNDIIAYFNIHIDNKTSEPTPDVSTSHKKVLPPQKGVPFSQQNESMFLNTNELGNNWSDNYSFIDSEVTQKHSFEFLDSSPEQHEKEPQQVNTSSKKSSLETRMEQMMNNRNEIKPFKRI
tara:strand:+ start:132 stop:686 length:555 start_codon:yes stop_codon:yes gene_type:complete